MKRNAGKSSGYDQLVPKQQTDPGDQKWSSYYLDESELVVEAIREVMKAVINKTHLRK